MSRPMPRVVGRRAILRRLIDASLQIQALAHGEYEDIAEVIDRAERAGSPWRIGAWGRTSPPCGPGLEGVDPIEYRSENKEPRPASLLRSTTSTT